MDGCALVPPRTPRVRTRVENEAPTKRCRRLKDGTGGFWLTKGLRLLEYVTASRPHFGHNFKEGNRVIKSYLFNSNVHFRRKLSTPAWKHHSETLTGT